MGNKVVIPEGVSTLNAKKMVESYTFFPPARDRADNYPKYFHSYLCVEKPSDTLAIGVQVPVSLISQIRSGRTFTHSIIIFCHGNASDVPQNEAWMRQISEKLGISVISFEYPGYGISIPHDLKPSEEWCEKTILRGYDFVVEHLGFKPEDIFVMSHSLGSGSAMALAREKKVAGVILMAPFLSVVSVAASKLGFDISSPITSSLLYLSRGIDIFRNQSKSSTIKNPIFIIHGTKDGVVPIQHSEELWNALSDESKYKPWWIEGGGHVSILDHSELIFHLLSFLQFCMSQERNRNRNFGK
jgi:pimeloyl-ACP methyl ester carboxylesterase